MITTEELQREKNRADIEINWSKKVSSKQRKLQIWSLRLELTIFDHFYLLIILKHLE